MKASLHKEAYRHRRRR